MQQSSKSFLIGIGSVVCALALSMQASTAERPATNLTLSTHNLGQTPIPPELLELRRELSRNAELANREIKTTQIIFDFLKRHGFTDLQANIANTGVIARLTAGPGKPTVAIRAPIDAFPIVQKATVTNATYLSKNPGAAHVCSHDAVTAMVLWVAKALMEQSKVDALANNYVFVFQGGEEGLPPGESGGAQMIVEKGLLDGVDFLLTAHADTTINSGEVGLHKQSVYASYDQPQLFVNAGDLHTALGRFFAVYPALKRPFTSVASQATGFSTAATARTVTLTKVKGGRAPNAVPGQIEIGGQLNYARLNRNDLEQKLRDIVQAVTRATSRTDFDGATAINFEDGRFEIDLYGKTAHGARPYLGIDALAMLHSLFAEIEKLNAAPSTYRLAQVRPYDEQQPPSGSPVFILSMIDSTRSNATLYVTGSMRTFDPQTRDTARKRFLALVAEKIKDGRADFIDEAPSVDNDACLVRQATPLLERVYGAGKIKAMEPFTYSDDFGFMTRKVPAAIYLQLGTINRAKGIIADSHTAEYDVDEDILVSGALALQELARQAPAQYALSATKGGCGR